MRQEVTRTAKGSVFHVVNFSNGVEASIYSSAFWSPASKSAEIVAVFGLHRFTPDVLCCAYSLIMSECLRLHGLQPTRLLCPWWFSKRECWRGLDGIFPTQGSNPALLHCRQILYQLSNQGSPYPQYVVSESLSVVLGILKKILQMSLMCIIIENNW